MMCAACALCWCVVSADVCSVRDARAILKILVVCVCVCVGVCSACYVCCVISLERSFC